MLVVDKPWGILVHAVPGVPGLSIVDVIRARYPDATDLQDGDYRAGVVHRLDRDTSGAIIIARTPAAASTLGRMFQSRDMEKIYWALVVGQPKHAAGTISAALAKVGEHGKQKMEWDDEEGKKAVTDYLTVAAAGGQYAQAKHIVGPLMAFNVALYLVFAYTLWMGQFISAAVLMGIERYGKYSAALAMESVCEVIAVIAVVPEYGIGGAARVIATGIVAAVKETGLTLPLVVRLEGNNVAAGKKTLAESGLTIISGDSMADAAQKVVKTVTK